MHPTYLGVLLTFHYALYLVLAAAITSENMSPGADAGKQNYCYLEGEGKIVLRNVSTYQTIMVSYYRRPQ
jgi:hypothetical protein